MSLICDIQSGDPVLAYEAAKKLPNSKPRPVKELLTIMFCGTAAHSRDAAAYALSWMSEPYHKEIYPALLRVAGDRLQPESLRRYRLSSFVTQTSSLVPITRRAQSRTHRRKRACGLLVVLCGRSFVSSRATTDSDAITGHRHQGRTWLVAYR